MNVYASALREVYERLLARFGPQHWWPAETRFEVMVGAVLTQATAWSNVEKAIGRLKTADALSPGGIRRLPVDELAQLVYPSGYYNAKARKLKALVTYLGDRSSAMTWTRWAGPTLLALTGGAAGHSRHRGGDRGRYPALRPGEAGVRSGRLHEEAVLPARPCAGARPLFGVQRSVYRQPALTTRRCSASTTP